MQQRAAQSDFLEVGIHIYRFGFIAFDCLLYVRAHFIFVLFLIIIWCSMFIQPSDSICVRLSHQHPTETEHNFRFVTQHPMFHVFQRQFICIPLLRRRAQIIIEQFSLQNHRSKSIELLCIIWLPSAWSALWRILKWIFNRWERCGLRAASPRRYINKKNSKW